MKKFRIVIYILLALGFFSMINQMMLKSLVDDNNKQQILIDDHALLKVKKDQVNLNAQTKQKETSESPYTGRISIKKSDLPRHEEGWKKYVENVVKESKILEAPQGQEAIKKMEISKKDFQEKMQRIEKQIQYFKEQKMSRPLDDDTTKRLQTLYKLKALGNILKDKVVTEEEIQEEILDKIPARP